ncbi:MAG TPA: XRE family transcriptional regulator [Rhodospirillales bacterium]|nr:XRE family transcriptional regulator [Rhodospirillales bacterium]
MSITVKPVSEDTNTIVLSKSDYRALLDALENAEARATFQESRDEETFPADVADRLVAGDHPVRVFRQYRQLTLTALANAAKVSISYLSEIESGRKPGSAKSLIAVAAVLDVGVEDLI